MGKLRPSSAKVWLNCPKSVALCEKAPVMENTYTINGTRKHDLAATYLRKKFKVGGSEQIFLDGNLKPVAPATLTKDEILEASRYAQYCFDTVKGIFGKHQAKILIEESLDLSNVLIDGSGKADFAAYDNDHILIIDYKSGYQRVYPRDNPQLNLYAIGVINLLTTLGVNVKSSVIYLAICQPSQDNYNLISISYNDLFGWLEENQSAILDAYRNHGEYKTGNHCRFCPARGMCRAYLLAEINKNIEGDEPDENYED